MRKYTVILFLISISLNGLTQVERPRNLPAFDYKTLHWGFTVGLNSMDFATVRNVGDDGTSADGFVYADAMGFQPAGFQVNIVSDLRLSDYWNLRVLPGINLGSRKMVYYNPADFTSPDTSFTIGSSFLDFPVIFKYRAERVNNYRPYVIGGFSFKYDMSAKKAFSDEDAPILLKRPDLYLEFGFGVDSYLQYFKHSTEIKVAIGMRNILQDNVDAGREQYMESISHLRSFIVMLNFHFE
jgi:hypothetical protein